MSNMKNQFVIFGNPVEHSKSPQMQNAGLKHINFDGNYKKHHLVDGNTIKDVFLQNNYMGANITVPHKEDAFVNADEVRGLAKEIKLPYKNFSVGDMFCIPSMFAEHMPPQDVSKAPTLANIFTYVIGDIGILASTYRTPDGPNGYRSIETSILLTGKADGYLYALCSADVYNASGISTRWVEHFQTTVVRFY